MPLKLYYLCPYSYFFFLICYELDDEFTLEDIIIPDVFGWYLYLLSLQNRIRGQKQTGVFVLIRFFRVVFILCSFQASKPMWKLYLVWAILSSVILLYIISKRCNVMSTIKTHKMTPVGTVLSFLHLFVLNLPQPAWLSESKFRWKSFTRSQFLWFHFSRLLTPPVCECHLEPCSPLSLNTDGNILCLFIFHHTNYSHHDHSCHCQLSTRILPCCQQWRSITMYIMMRWRTACCHKLLFHRLNSQMRIRGDM